MRTTVFHFTANQRHLDLREVLKGCGFRKDCLFPTGADVMVGCKRPSLGHMRTRCSSSDLLPTKSFSSGSVGFSSGSVVRNLPAMQETRVLSLDQEDPLEKEMATHSSVLAWKIPWTEETGRIQFMRLQELDMT